MPTCTSLMGGWSGVGGAGDVMNSYFVRSGFCIGSNLPRSKEGNPLNFKAVFEHVCYCIVVMVG